MRERNEGFSLIELVVSIAILGLVSVAIYQFAITSSRHYQKETKEVELQYEAQLAMNQLQDLLIDAARGVSYEEGTGESRLTVYNADAYYEVTWKQAEEKLFLTKYDYDESSRTFSVSGSADSLMAEHVSDFKADLSAMAENNSIYLDVIFRTEKEYGVSQNVTLRNRVAVNAPLNEIYQP